MLEHPNSNYFIGKRLKNICKVGLKIKFTIIKEN